MAVQAGSHGNLVVDNSSEHWEPALPIRQIDDTGAGDAFVATLAVWLARGRPLSEAARYANAAAAFATTALGAQGALARRADLDALIALNEGR